MQKHVLVINQGKSENIGDKAINIILKDILEENDCQVTSAGYSQCKEQRMDTMSPEFKKSSFSSLRKWVPPFLLWFLKYIWLIKEEFNQITKENKYDLVIIGGGQLIKTKNVFVYSLLTWYWLIKKELNCPIVILGVGADDKFTMIEKFIYKKILSGIEHIYVRDNNSKKIMKKEFGVDCKLIPDVAFTYSKYYPASLTNKKNINLVMIYDYSSLKHHFGVSHSINEYYETWKNLILENMEQGHEIVLGYTTIGDKSETLKFAKFLRETSNIDFTIADTDSIEKFIKILEKTNKVISARMHALILGMNYDCKVIPYIVSSKIKTFKEEWIDSDINLPNTRLQINKAVNDILDKHRAG